MGLLSQPAWAADFRVPQDGDLAAAVQAVPNGGIIEISPGTYTPPADGYWLSNLGKSFTIEGGPGGTTRFDGTNNRTIMRIMNNNLSANGTITFKNLTFRRGRSTAYQQAGAVTVTKGRAIFDDCVFDRNVSDTTNTGGGALLLSGGSTVTVRDSFFMDNSATTEGGAVVAYDSTLTVERSQFFENRVNLPGHRSTSAGGAIALMNSNATVKRTRFEGNEAGFAAGAIYGYGQWSGSSTPNAQLTVDNCTFDSNRTNPEAGNPPPEPEQGGAIHVEDQARVDITNSRFYSNSAEGGGAVNGYRAIIHIEDTIFRGNRALGLGVGNGYGGSIGLLSGDTGVDNWNNRPSGSLTVRRSFIQCAWGGVTTAAQSGGAIFASGDRNRSYGIGIPKMGTPASNAARVILDELAIVDCHVQGNGIAGEGGGFELSQVDADITDVIVLDSSATGDLANGGGGRIVFESSARIADSTFAQNAATHLGGGLVLLGSEVDVEDSNFTMNEVSPGVNEPWGQSAGAGLFVGPIRDFLGFKMDAHGEVSSSQFADNIGIAIFDDDDHSNAINDVRYNSNRFDESTFGADVYQDPIMGPPVSPSGLNALVVQRSGASNTDKSQQGNDDTGLITGAVLAVPSLMLDEVAEGDPVSSGESFLVYTWSGASAKLDGSTVTGNGGFTSTTPGNHTLEVGGQRFHASVEQAEPPEPPLFSDGFESGGFGNWSVVVD